MVLQASKFLTSRKYLAQDNQTSPILTSIPTNFNGGVGLSRFGQEDYKNFWRYFEQNAELVATLSIPITDILGDRPEFTGKFGEKLGKTELKRAQLFWRDNKCKEILRAALFDTFLTGDGYLWKGTPSKKAMLAAMKEVLEAQGISTLQIKEDFLLKQIDEDTKKAKAIDYVASSTMRVISTELDILGYEQRANGLTAQFTPDRIIHIRYLTLNGRTQGFTPIQPLMAEIILLGLIKGNMNAVLENGGTPDKVFVLPKEIAKSKNHQYLVETLQKYKKIQNRHGNLVFTGEIDIQDLQGNIKDMEYKELALYVTSNIAFAYGIPVSRIPYLIGSSATGGDSGGLGEKGYYMNISDWQDSLEDALNSQLFEAYGWNIKFNRGYKQDNLRQAQIDSMNADTLQKIQTLLQSGGMKIKTTKIAEKLGINEEDLEEYEDEMKQLEMESMAAENSMMGQNQLPNRQTMPESDNQKRAGTKRNVANSKDVGVALQNP